MKTSWIKPKPIKMIGFSTISNDHSWWLCDDGNVWYCYLQLVSNCGPLDNFLNDVKNGMYRIELL
jgi:hypothetical protein